MTDAQKSFTKTANKMLTDAGWQALQKTTAPVSGSYRKQSSGEWYGIVTDTKPYAGTPENSWALYKSVKSHALQSSNVRIDSGIGCSSLAVVVKRYFSF